MGEDDVDAVAPFALVDVGDVCEPEVVEDDEFNEVLNIEELFRDVGGWPLDVVDGSLDEVDDEVEIWEDV